MSIKSYVSTCLTAVGALLALMATLLFIDNWHSYRAARDAGQLVSLLGSTTKISEALAPERGATSVALDGDPAARKTLTDIRSKLDAIFSAVEAEAGASPLAEGKEASDAVTKLHATMTNWRTKTDAVSGGNPQQITAFRKEFILGINDTLTKAGNITATLGRRLSALDAEVANPASLAETTWQLRDHAGQLSILNIAALSSHQPFTPEQIRDMYIADGRIQQSWERLTTMAGSPESPEGLKDGITKVEAGFIAPFKPLRDRVAKAGLSGGAYDVDPAEWRRQSAPMLQAIMVMRDAAINEAHRVAEEKQDHAFRNLILMGSLLVIAALTLTAVVMGIHRQAVVPLVSLTTIISEFANGSRDFTVPFIDRGDETGRMAKAIEVLRNKAQESDRNATQEALASRIRDERRQRIESVTARFVESIDSVVGGVTTAIHSLRTTTETISKASTTTTDQSSIVASAANQASANVQTVASAAEELSNSIQEISRRVAETASAMDGAVREAESTNATIRELAEAAHHIGDVVSLITDIASQTNLLALNATIEAARAGEAGKGFAVVAGEVKNLANQTARATDDIQAQVAAIQAKTGRAVSAIAGIGTTITTVNQYTMGIASAVEQQGAATKEIARNVQQAAAGTTEVSNSIGRVLEAERQTGTAVDQLSSLEDSLAQESDRLRGNVSNFVAEIKKG